MPRKPLRTVFAVISVLVLVLIGQASAQAPDRRNVFHVLGQSLPASPASPTSAEGKALTYSLTVGTITVANYTGSAQTFTVEDCQGTPFIPYNAAAIAGGTTQIINLNGTLFGGCFKWGASSTGVQGSVVGGNF